VPRHVPAKQQKMDDINSLNGSVPLDNPSSFFLSEIAYSDLRHSMLMHSMLMYSMELRYMAASQQHIPQQHTSQHHEEQHEVAIHVTTSSVIPLYLSPLCPTRSQQCTKCCEIMAGCQVFF